MALAVEEIPIDQDILTAADFVRFGGGALSL